MECRCDLVGGVSGREILALPVPVAEWPFLAFALRLLRCPFAFVIRTGNAGIASVGGVAISFARFTPEA